MTDHEVILQECSNEDIYNYNMTYKEEGYVLDTLIEIQETIRSPEFKQLIK